MEVTHSPGSDRVRGRIEKPPGYISLRRLTDGLRWAEPFSAQEAGEENVAPEALDTPVPKAAQLAKPQVAQDPTGVYVIRSPVVVSAGLAPCEKPIQVKLCPDMHVEVLEIWQDSKNDRIRGRIKEPAGYISLRNLLGDVHWAEPFHVDETPGEYIVNTSVVVGSEAFFHYGSGVTLAPGTRVTVVEVARSPGSDRVRGRIEEPPGYISLRNLSDGHRFAEHVSRRAVTEDSIAPEASQLARPEMPPKPPHRQTRGIARHEASPAPLSETSLPASHSPLPTQHVPVPIVVAKAG